MIPSKKQFEKWSIPSKASYVGLIATFVSLALAIVFWWTPNTSKISTEDQIHSLANVFIDRVLESSSICCEIGPVWAVASIPPEGEAYISANNFKDHNYENPNGSKLDLAFTQSIEDSIKVFGCNNLGENEVDIYYFTNGKLACKQPSILELFDPNQFCSQK